MHATLISVTSIAGVFLSAGIAKATAAGSNVPKGDIKRYKDALHLYKLVAVPYLAGFFMYYAFPRATKFWCFIRLVYDELIMALGFAALVLMSASFSDKKYTTYMIIWFSVVVGVRVAYLIINQFFNFVGRERPIPF